MPIAAAPQTQAGQAAVPGADRTSATDGAFAYASTVGFAQGRHFVVGVYAPHGRPPSLRAWDGERRVVWEILQGQTWVAKLTAAQLAVSAGTLYVAAQRGLSAFDLATGARKWGMQLSDHVAEIRGPLGVQAAVFDPFPPQGRAAILVQTIDHMLFGVDRDNGQVLWSEQRECEVVPLAGQSVVLAAYGAPYVKAHVINPAYQRPIAVLEGTDWSADLGPIYLSGRSLLLMTDDYPHEDDHGAAVVDALTGQLQFFHPVDDLAEDVRPAAMGPRAFFAASDGEAIFVAPDRRTMPAPIPNHVVTSLLAAGPVLAVFLQKRAGSPVRRLLGLDPMTLQVRFDSGELGTEPSDDYNDQLVSDGYSIVVVASENDDADTCELRSLDTTTGRPLWRRPIGAWQAHCFESGYVLVRAAEKLWVFAAQDGRVVASFP
jgi:outer membrane protein assembly factor BamB